MLGAKGDLAAAEVAFFSIALIISVFIIVRHGFKREAGWLYIALLSVLRLVGGGVTLYMYANNDLNISLIITASICSSIGTAPLLLALMGFLDRISNGMDRKGLPQIVFRPLRLLATAGLAVGIAGGVERGQGDAQSASTGKSLSEAGAIVFLVVFIGLALICIYSMLNIQHVLRSERHLMYACIFALPFLVVRVIYTICAAFAGPGSMFYYLDTNVYASAFMQFLMEALIVCIYLIAGALTPKAPKTELREGSYDAESQKPVEMEPQRHTRAPPAERRQQRPRAHQPRTIGDYRPSRLIMNAIRDRQ